MAEILEVQAASTARYMEEIGALRLLVRESMPGIEGQDQEEFDGVRDVAGTDARRIWPDRGASMEEIDAVGAGGGALSVQVGRGMGGLNGWCWIEVGWNWLR